ncbi:PepSY domain-containing protein [Sphingomonas quercus]|uniref:PepSY domain-containing protein n=1 Tax=Sphingomonas quercus TaxID=2842451 RepID=A0ABS6BKJ7_9SPHN|nr:PepSY domain-containing protein [Sphingomonas quercus]MBU3078341.1 PepSY domain-containing protein [Sphingomonas quercus]
MNRAAIAMLGLIGIAAAAPALADRGPSQGEAQAIAASLTAAGFKSWNKIQYDEDGQIWKVDDARAIDGKTYDLQLSPKDYGIVKKDGD